MQRPPKLVEYWRWRYRDPVTGRMCRTLFQLSERQAAGLPDAERIKGSMLLREVDADDFPETGPDVHRITTEPVNAPALPPGSGCDHQPRLLRGDWTDRTTPAE